MKRSIRSILAGACACLFVMTAAAQSYPSKPVRIIVPFAPGGTTDMVARVIGAKLAEFLGQPVVVDNKGGGGTIIGTDALAKSPADGYTMMLATPDFTINPGLQPRLPYDTQKDFAPVALIATYPMIFVVNAEHRIGSVSELVAQAKARPGQINIASAGNGSMPHLCAELLNNLASVKLTVVPYKGNGPALNDLLAGHVSLLFSGGPPVAAHIKSGRLKALGVTTSKRHVSMPDAPTLAESGVPGYEVTAWFGFIAPAGVPKDVIARLNTEIGRALAAPDVRDKLASLGADLGASTPDAFATVIGDEIDKWSRLVRAANIKLE